MCLYTYTYIYTIQTDALQNSHFSQYFFLNLEKYIGYKYNSIFLVEIRIIKYRYI